MSKELTPKEVFKAKVRRAHKVYTNEDGVQMCEMEFRKYLVMEQALTELEELKKRDTAMQITQASRFTNDKKLYGMYACNNCHEVIPYITLNSKRIKPSFCYYCGQKLDWSDEK